MKVLLLMSDTGGGHRAAAQAIAESLRRINPGVDIEIVDIIREMSPFWFRVVSLYGPIVRRAPWLWGVLFKLFGTQTKAPLWQMLVPLLILTIRRKILPYVAARRPDVVCSTHPLINQTTQYARELVARDSGMVVPFMIVVTDPVTFHPSWIEPAADMIVVATEEARQTAVACGAPPEKVHVLGHPIHPNFFARAQLGTGESPQDARTSARAELNLPADANVVLVCGGGEGLNSMGAMVEQILQRPEQPWVLAVAGRNKPVQEALEARARQPGGERLVPFGFTDKMSTLMRASDVVVTKAGPGTMFEAMALGKPLVIADALPGQEQGNVDLVRNHNVGRVALRGPQDVSAGVGEMLGGDVDRAAVAERALMLSKPNASHEIASALLRLGGRA